MRPVKMSILARIFRGVMKGGRGWECVGGLMGRDRKGCDAGIWG